ncbi:MAG: hypothetical protein E6J86_03050 [Deltaproteobacteria bacterium]|nr:MAG: hypothetical protein E6J86_03050 [Deltaproteobacteria bacterium]
MRWIATTLCAACGAALLVAARALDLRWFELHVLLPWYYPWAPSWVPDVRVAAAVCGVVLLASAWPLGRGLARSSLAGWLRILLAIALGLATSGA